MVHNKEERSVDKTLKENPMEHFILSSILLATTAVVFALKARRPAYRPVRVRQQRRY